jgi:sulfhydrogenase subunit beta (sulfur reductase)
MVMKKVTKVNLGALLQEWGASYSVFTPHQLTDGKMKMAAWDGQDIAFLNGYRNTDIAPKASFLPAMEEMFSIRKERNGHYQLETPVVPLEKQLFFGIRPCDARALTILDPNFQGTYEDPYYLPKRHNSLLVGLACVEPYDSCFCTSLGSGPYDKSSVDVMATDIGDAYLLEGVSPAGKALLDKSDLPGAASEKDIEKAHAYQKESHYKITRKLDTEGLSQRLLAIFENKDYWERVAAKCVSCGICTLLCPTCYCFDINDEMLQGKGRRLRSLDSCSFPVYTKMPAENPRAEKWRRVRNKVYHKYVFYPMNCGVVACTGCGRCIRLCPVNWDIQQVLAAVPAQT